MFESNVAADNYELKQTLSGVKIAEVKSRVKKYVFKCETIILGLRVRFAWHKPSDAKIMSLLSATL